MRLADFILANREPILAEWEAFARSCAPASHPMDVAALRDHADEMLGGIAAQLRRAAGAEAPTAAASPGAGPGANGSATTAASEHGAGRARSGFTVVQMVAEYRALRATVIRLWTAEQGTLETDDIEDLTRFNEALDQSLTESVACFTTDVETAKETLLAILGHDLRAPLGAISTSATFIRDSGALGETHRALSAGIVGSARRSMAMVGDLLDFTRSRLGGGIPVVRAETELGEVLRDLVDEHRAAHPGRTIRIDMPGPERGHWDAARLGQAFGNLIGNAVQHGDEGTPVTITVRGSADAVTVAVHNEGAVIPGQELDGIFNPMKVRPATSAPPAPRGPTDGLGLGLYIAERIVSAHDGHIDVASTAGAGTIFTVRLPRGGVPNDA
jgi:signal transduction histidine kinase